MIVQVKKTQAQISIWGFLVASRLHRSVLIKLLDELVIPLESTPTQPTSKIGTFGV